MLTNCFVYVGEISGDGGEAEQALLKCSRTRYVHAERETAFHKLLDTVVHILPLSLLSFPLSFLLFFLFLLFSSPIPPLSPPHLLNLSKPVAISVSVNHLYGYCWEEDEGETDLQWCRALVVAVRKNEVHVCQCSALTTAAPLHGMMTIRRLCMTIRKGYLCARTRLHIQADVMFPDYGNSETVSCRKLKQLPERFHTLPFQVSA